MKPSNEFEFDDLQALLRFGHGKLTDTCFMLLKVIDAGAAKAWLDAAPVSPAVKTNPPPDTALQIAFSADGMRALGLKETVIEGFSDEFITGMAGDESRSRRLGDTGDNAPAGWDWGGVPGNGPHVLMLLYAREGGMAAWRKTVEREPFSTAFERQLILPTRNIGDIEPFGFADGISQPEIDWAYRQSTDAHARDAYSNWVAPGEFVLGYPNEYGLYTTRPLIDPELDRLAMQLPAAADNPRLRDFGRNGSYLVIRQLHQDVPGFWQFLDRMADGRPAQRDRLAAAIVGRTRDGTPLVPSSATPIGGIPDDDTDNHFTYASDPLGHQCPRGAHIRRSNPRTGDLPPGVTGTVSRLMKMLGLARGRPDEDLVAATRFHRLLRRGRGYGPVLAPEDAVKPDAPQAARGLQFIALMGNIKRQFEFIQNAWTMSSAFDGLKSERDPLLGIREPRLQGGATDCFHRGDPSGPDRTLCRLPQFVTLRGGGYFFMPGLRALRYLAASPNPESDGTP